MKQTPGHMETPPDQATWLGGFQIVVCNDLSVVEPAWAKLETEGVASFYQTLSWCRAWMKELAALNQVSPCFVLARTLDGTPCFLLPLQVRRRFGARVLEFLTAPNGSYGFGLYSRSFITHDAQDWFRDHFDALLQLLPEHDAVHLRDMPKHVLGYANPLAALRQFRSDNTTHILILSPDYDALFASKRSAESRRSIRKRDAKLEALGKLEFGLPAPGEESHRVLRDMFNDQEIRLAEAGVHGVFKEEERRFVHTLMDTSMESPARLRPYRLTLDGKPLAVMLGGVYQSIYWALISSLTSGDVRKYSPGDRALRDLIAALCEDGLTHLDFSPGDSPYKLHWTDESVPLYHLFRARTLRGLPAAIILLFGYSAKRLIKTNKILKYLAYGARRLLSGRS